MRESPLWHRVFTILLCSVASIEAQSSTTPPNIALVARYLSLVEVSNLVAASRIAQSRGELTVAQSECIKRTDHQLFFSVATNFLSSSLSAQEQRVAADFLRSEGGIALMSKAERLILADSENVFLVVGDFLDAHRDIRVQRFYKTDAGRKLFEDDLFHKGASGELVLKASQSRVQQCRRDHHS